MKQLSIEDLKELRSNLQWINSNIPELRDFAEKQAAAYDELIAIREAHGVPVAIVELNDNLTVAEIRGDIPRRKAVKELYEGALVVGQELFTAPQSPVAPLTFEEWCIKTEQNPLGWVRDAMKEAYEGALSAVQNPA